MRYVALATLALLIVAGTSSLESVQEDHSKEIMWRKLDLTHDALDALVLDDFEALEAYALDLETLGVAGVFHVLDTEEYRTRAESFRFTARALLDAARNEDSHAGAVAYADLTLQCVRCHRMLGVLPR